MKHIPFVLLATTLTGCAEMPRNMPLIFTDSVALGISVGTGATETGVDVTYGFKARSAAIVPVTTGQGKATTTYCQQKADGSACIPDKITDTEASTTKLSATKTSYSTVTNFKNDGTAETAGAATGVETARDAYSVFGQFSADTTVDTQGNKLSNGLGKFFATGVAAQKLAEGFAKKLSSDTGSKAVDSTTEAAQEKKNKQDPVPVTPTPPTDGAPAPK